MKPFASQTHYEVLEISVSANVADVRAAYERLTRLYSEEQVALYGLVDGAMAEALRARLRAAVEVLSDDVRRDAYDVEIGLPPREPVAPAPPPVPAPPSPPKWNSYAFVAAEPPPPAPSPTGVTYTVQVESLPLPTERGEYGGEGPDARPSPGAALPAVQGEVTPPAVLPAEPEAVIDARPSPGAALRPLPAAQGEVTPPAASIPVPAEQGEVTPPEGDDDAPIVAPKKEHRAEPKPEPYDIPDGVEINGDLLRQVRLARGLTLAQLSDRLRISTRHLENVEADRYAQLPAQVYLRGMLMNLARELGLDGLRVSRSYLTFVEANRSKG